ncbi:MAG: class I SAM-dependent methyltransferase [Phycisphaerae bacterium]|jgi:cyclopropane fatty-acyl-phospholipid synthase-like methyltransferase
MVGSEGVEKRLFHEIYDGTPPWEIGRPQPVFERLAAAGEIAGDVLDVGCGTGENALMLAARGLRVVGVDFVPAAIERARQKCAQRGLVAEFVVGDALELGGLGRTFDTVIDCGLFHTFSDGDRPRFAASVRAALRPGGRLILMCFSEHETSEKGPRRVTQAELRAAFSYGWRVESVEAALFDSNIHAGGARAWLARIARC